MKPPMMRYAMLVSAAVLTAGAVWRAVEAVHHYRLSLAVVDDPSIRELEQVSAGFEVGFSLLLLVHAAALAVISRRPLEIRVPCVLGVALVCAVILSGSLLGTPLFSVLGVYPVSIVVGVAILSHYLVFGWVSLYLGAAAGGVLAWFVAAPAADAFACLFVVAPCVALAFGGAGLRFLLRSFIAARV